MVKDTGDLALVGRDGELASILQSLDRGEQGRPGIVLILGEAGVGKSRLAQEAVARARERCWRVMSGKCLHQSLTPYMSITEALREGKLEHLMEFSRPPRVEQILFIYPDGRLCARASRSEGKLDSEIFAGMLMAVGTFVKDSLSGMMDAASTGEGFNVMGYDRFRILVGSRPQGNLVLILTGQETELLKDEMAETLDRILRSHGALLREWDGDAKGMEPLASELERYIKSGKYDGVDEVTEPENRHWRLLINVTRGIARASKEAPLLLVLDDLQWADPSSLGLVRYLMKRLKNERFMVLGTCRPEELGPDHPFAALKKELESDGRIVELAIGSMGKADVVAMVELELGEPLARGELGELIARESGGNPFMARELVALLKEEGTVVKEGGNWRLTKKIGKIGIPKKVGEAILARLGGLSREEREVLETGAIMGELFRPRPVSCVLKVEPLQVHRALREIEKRYKLVRNIEEGKHYRFDHPLVREVIYGEVPREMREEYHRTAVDCLVREGGSGMAYLTEVAYHAAEGKHPDAVAHLQAAGDAAKAEYHNAEAVHFYEGALGLMKEEGRPRLFELLGDTQLQAGRLGDAVAWYEKARNATPLGDKHVILTAKLGRAIDRQGDPNKAWKMLQTSRPNEHSSPNAIGKWRAARAWIRRALRKFEGMKEDAEVAINAFKAAGGSSEDIADCWNSLGAIDGEIGRWSEAESYFKNGLAEAEAGGAQYQIGRILGNLGLMKTYEGHILEALGLFEHSMQIRERIGNQFGVAVSHYMIGYAQYLLGRNEEAFDTLTTSIRLCDEVGARNWTIESIVMRALCMLEMGRPEEAEREVRAALVQAEDLLEETMFSKAVLGEILIARGNNREAITIIRDAMDLYGKPGNKPYLAMALRILATAYAKEGDRREAEKLFPEIFNACGDFMYASDHANSLRLWGEALASWGENGKAMEKLEAARTRFTEMSAARELKKVEAALTRVRTAF